MDDLIPSSDSDTLSSRLSSNTNDLIAIDYTHPSSVNSNAELYVASKIPFVMGTTGGDRSALSSAVEGHDCVVAPNMGKQIVAMQYALSNLMESFPKAFEGYELKVVESHQKTKADTSGTAKAVIESINGLTGGQPFPEEKVTLLRDDESSLAFGVPRESLTTGHAFHTYTLTSPDGTVEFELKHNVCGRRVYAEGTADAVKFLAGKRGEGKCWSMEDVLAAGGL